MGRTLHQQRHSMQGMFRDSRRENKRVDVNLKATSANAKNACTGKKNREGKGNARSEIAQCRVCDGSWNSRIHLAPAAPPAIFCVNPLKILFPFSKSTLLIPIFLLYSASPGLS